MRKFLLPILLLTSLFAREYIAIIDFEGISVSEADAKALTQRLTSEMIKLEVYQVLERSEMKRLLEEQKFQYSGCVDMKCAVEIGKMIGAKYMVVGTVSMVGSTYSLESRLINVETSEAYISASFAHKGKIDVLLIDGISSIARQLCELDSNLQDSQSQQLSYIPAQPTKPALNLLKSKEKELKKKGSQYSSESIFLSFNFGDSKKEVKSKIDGLLKSGKLRDRCNQCNYGYPNYIFNLEGSNRYFHMQFLYTNDELYCIKLEGHWLAPDEYEAMASLYKQKYGTGTGFTKKETQTLEGWRAYNAYIWEINNDLEIFIYMKDVGEANTYIQYLSRTLQESKKYNDKKKSKESIDDL